MLAQEGIADQADLRTNTRAVRFAPGTHQESGPTSYRADGLPVVDDNRQFTWDAAGRLREVREEGKSLARYAYNHRGERIAKSVGDRTTRYLYENRQLQAELDAHGRMTRLYLYLADRPVAVVDTPEGAALVEDTPEWRQALADLATILAGFFAPRETTVWLHADHLGAPVAATATAGQVVWRADYAPFGAVKVADNGFTLNLRRPGQYEDAETGLFYNGQRYYDPQRGSYLSPDPLGAPDGPNPYAYVAFNPLRFVDPDGLILFAFDGTNNSNPPPGIDDFSNVYKFYLAYDVDSPTTTNGDRAWYMNGIGRDDPDSGITTNGWDEINGNTGHARVNYMLDQLNDYVVDKDVSDGKLISLDIVGFSRGGALARDFANRVATLIKNNTWGSKTACVAIRFMGLWDTVAQFGLNGANNGSWQLAIPTEAQHVYQAVAMNENRYLFPGESIGTGIQRGFVGSHADIGGSYGTGDLSDVALNWIVEQAKTSGITMKDWDKIEHSEWGKVTNPVVHDKAAEGEESAFCLRTNNQSWASNCVARSSATPGGLTATQILAEGFIIPREKPGMDADGKSPITGDVNMEKYAKWLQENYGFTVDYEP